MSSQVEEKVISGDSPSPDAKAAGVSRCVSVIVAARNAALTIERAVRSALAEPETLEVIVVDDASDDGTDTVVRAIEPSGERVRVFRLETNLGPGGARNLALDAARGDFVTILDADDFMLPGRLGQLCAARGKAEIIADDLCLSEAAQPMRITGRLLGQARIERLTLEAFALGNAVRPGKRPKEMGFLKPLFRRDFLERNRLRYEPDLRLGEDFVLYAQALAAGAEFLIAPAFGYIAVRHEGSLSRKHATADLAAFHRACLDLANDPRLSAAQQHAMQRQVRNVARRFAHRELLDMKRVGGLRGVAAWLRSNWTISPQIGLQIVKDKLRI